MSERTGLGPLEVAILEVVGTRRGRRRTTAVLEDLEQRHGIAPVYALRILQDLVAPWRRHLPLLDGNGNWGTDGDDLAADPRYTSLGLTPVGRLALDAEQGAAGPVPLGIIDGTLYAGGRVPPFDPRAVVDALRAQADHAGSPAVPTGGEVHGEVPALLAGKRARLQLGPRVVREADALVITGLPLGVSRDELARCLDSRVRSARFRRYGGDYLGEPQPPATVPVSDVQDETSMFAGTRVVCRLAADTAPEEAERWVRGVWPVTIEVDCQLPAPQRKRLAGWGRGDGTGLLRLAELLG